MSSSAAPLGTGIHSHYRVGFGGDFWLRHFVPNLCPWSVVNKRSHDVHLLCVCRYYSITLAAVPLTQKSRESRAGGAGCQRQAEQSPTRPTMDLCLILIWTSPDRLAVMILASGDRARNVR
jgi:hypothetical protein